MLRTALAYSFGALVLAAPALPFQGQDAVSVDDLKAIETARDEAILRLERVEASEKIVERELSEIDAELVAAAADSRRHEVAATESEARLELLVQQETTARQALLEDEETLEDVLATLMTFGSRQPPALAASPNDAGDAVRAAILMGDIAPKLADRAQRLAEEIDKISALQAGITHENEDLARTQSALAARREQIEALFAEKRALRTELAIETAELRAETQQLASEARSLRDLLDKLAANAPDRPNLKSDVEIASPSRKPRNVALKPPELKPRTSPATLPVSPLPPTENAPFVSNSTIQPPVSGDLVLAFGAPTEASLPHRGQTWQTREGAQVVAPRDGRIEYAGPFRSYGKILIIDVGEGYLVVLAGMDSLYGETGQTVLSGEPVGRMAEIGRSQPQLYMEVRKDGELMDPSLWLGRNV